MSVPVSGFEASAILAALGFLPLAAGMLAAADNSLTEAGKWIVIAGAVLWIPLLSRLLLLALLS